MHILKKRKGFTLVEMLVTIAVLAILVLIGAPKLLGHVEQAQLTRVQHDVKVMEQEMEIAFLNNKVEIEDWDTNAKDLGSLILQDKLYDKKGFANNIDKSHLEKYFNQNSVDENVGTGGMLYALGNITPFNNDNQEQKDDDDIANLIAAGYKIIPEEYKDTINTKLKGTFYTNEEGTVYYENGKPLSTQKASVDKVCEAPTPSPDYDFDHESGTIVKWNGTEQHLTIPSAFKVGDKCYPVRILGTGSFMQGGKRTIKTVIIPQSVQRIEEKAFYGNELTEVEIPHSVNYIGESAFEYNYIETVIIRNKVGVITVGGGAFDNNGPSKNRTVTPSYKQPSNKDLGIIFDTSRGAIVASSRPRSEYQDSVVHIPKTIIVNGKEEVIKVVDRGAYQGLGLISVVMPEGLERIEDYAFSGNQLTGVTIPSTVNHIGNYAFSFNEQIHSETGEIKPTIKSVMINNEEQFGKIDKRSGDIKEHGVKVDLLNNKVNLLDHVFVNSLGNKVIIVDEFVPGATEEQKENHIINDKIINLPSLPSKPKDPVKDEDGSYVSGELGPEGLMSVAEYGLVAPITDPEGLVSVVDYETVDPITTPEGLDSLRQYNDGPISFSGVGAAAFDNDLNTSAEIKTYSSTNSSNRVVTWNGDLTDRMISIKANGFNSRMSFVNSNGSHINHQDDNGKTSNSAVFNSTGATRKVKVPKDAVGIKFYNSSRTNEDMYIYDISVKSDDRPIIDKGTISHTATTSSITLSWDKQYKKAYIYEGNNFLSEVSGNSYTHTPLYSNSAHTYNITLLNDNGVGMTATYKANVKTIGIDFRGIDADAFDDDLNTSTEIKTYSSTNSNNRVVSWNGDLTDRMISIKANGFNSRMSFVDSNGSHINHQDDNGKTSNSAVFNSTGATRKVKVPKDAVGIKFYNSSRTNEDMYIYDISVKSDDRPIIDKDTISHTATTSSITLSWDKQYKKAYIYEGNNFLSEVSGNSYTHTPLYSNSAHTYNITLLNDNGVGTTATYKANVKTIGIDFRGIDADAFDDDLNTSVEVKTYSSNSSSNRVVTWNGDLTDRMISIKANGFNSRMSFVNSNGNHINHQDDNGKTSNSAVFNSTGATRKVKVPKDAVGIKFYNSSRTDEDMYIYDISVKSDDRPIIDKDTISHTATTSSITLSWDKQYKKAYIYEGNNFLSEVSGNSYTHTPLYSNSAHTYNITLLNDNGVGTTATYKANVKTIGIDFRGIDADAFDDDLNTSAEVKTYSSNNSSNRVVTWNGDLTDRMISIKANGFNSRMSFVNSNGSHINHQDDNGKTSNSAVFNSTGATRKVKVPKDAVGIKFYNSSRTDEDMYIYDISVED